MRKVHEHPVVKIDIPPTWANKVTVGQLLTVGEYPNQEKYEILYINQASLYVKVRRKNN